MCVLVPEVLFKNLNFQQSLVITQLRVEIEKLERSGLGNASNSDQKWGRGFIAHIKDELESHFSCAICTEVSLLAYYVALSEKINESAC